MYIVPYYSRIISDAFQVADGLDVAEYFLTEDDTATIAHKICWAIFSDFVLNFLCDILQVSPRKLYLRYIYDQLNENPDLDPNFVWGDEKFVYEYFS
jgi:hypothetical protein